MRDLSIHCAALQYKAFKQRTVEHSGRDATITISDIPGRTSLHHRGVDLPGVARGNICDKAVRRSPQCT